MWEKPKTFREPLYYSIIYSTTAIYEQKTVGTPRADIVGGGAVFCVVNAITAKFSSTQVTPSGKMVSLKRGSFLCPVTVAMNHDCL